MSEFVLTATWCAHTSSLFERGKVSNAQVNCLIVAECSDAQLMVGDTQRRWGKHVSKGLLLIEGREHVISLAPVVLQGT